MGRDAPVVIRKQTGGVAVLTKTEQHQIEIAEAVQGFRISEPRRAPAEFGEAGSTAGRERG